MIKFSKKGQTLLGVMFAVGITVVGLLALVGLLRYLIIAGRFSEDKFIATNLAEEGIEIVRAYRDSNWKANMTDNSDLNTTTFNITTPTNYKVDYRAVALLPYINENDSILNIDSDGFYSYAAGTATKFRRRIYLDPYHNDPSKCAGDQGQCIGVVSEVKWGNYQVIIEDRLYNWKP